MTRTKVFDKAWDKQTGGDLSLWDNSNKKNGINTTGFSAKFVEIVLRGMENLQANGLSFP